MPNFDDYVARGWAIRNGLPDFFSRLFNTNNPDGPSTLRGAEQTIGGPEGGHANLTLVFPPAHGTVYALRLALQHFSREEIAASRAATRRHEQKDMERDGAYGRYAAQTGHRTLTFGSFDAATDQIEPIVELGKTITGKTITEGVSVSDYLPSLRFNGTPDYELGLMGNAEGERKAFFAAVGMVAHHLDPDNYPKPELFADIP